MNGKLTMQQLAIQPNIPSHMMLTRSHSRRIVNQKAPPTFNTKTLRMKSLLWSKPTGVATSTFSSTLRQLVPTLIVNLAALSSGLSLGFSAIALPQLKGNATESNETFYYHPFEVDMQSGSWIASIFGLGAIFGGFAAAYLGSRFGRRKALSMMAAPDILGWILIAAAQNAPMMLIGRFLNGFAASGYSSCIQIFVAEISQPQHRGWLCGLSSPMIAFGALVSYGMGALVSWQYVATLGVFLPLLMVPGLVMLEDSPYWYLQNGDERKALRVMEKFRGQGANSLAELLAIADSFNTSADEFSMKDSLKNFTHRQYRRPFLILNFLFLLMTFSGNFAITFYAVDVFKHALDGRMSAHLATVIMGIIKLAGTVIYIPAVKYLSRRLLICSSSFVMGVCMSILGLAMYSHETGLISSLESMTWLPLLCVIVYMLADSVGLGAVPFLYVAEFFPSEMRSLLSGITIGLANLELFLVVKTFPDLSLSMGDSGTFWMYAVCCFLTILFTLIWVPETKGRSLSDIEKYFSYKESLHVTPLPTPMGTPATSKRGLAPYPHLSIQFTL